MIIDKKYLSLIGSRFGIVDKGKHKICRCPICGDSKNNKHKMRGYFIVNHKRNRMQYYCHNCDANMFLGTFIKNNAPALYEEYKKERAMETFKPSVKRNTSGDTELLSKLQYNVPVKKKSALESNTQDFKINKRVLEYLTPITKAPKNIQMYLYNRKIPFDIAKKYFYYTPEFMAYTNMYESGKFSEGAVKHYDEPRIVILMYNEEEKCTGFQGRKLPESEAQAKYITIKLEDEEGKAWGRDRIDKSKPVIVLEGPIDACLVDNAVGVCGADLVSQSTYIKGDNKYVYFFDNEPRNIHIVKKMESAVVNNKKIVILPPEIKQKDVNDIILQGHDINTIIKSNTFSGLTARMKLAAWRKC